MRIDSKQCLAYKKAIHTQLGKKNKISELVQIWAMTQQRQVNEYFLDEYFKIKLYSTSSVE